MRCWAAAVSAVRGYGGLCTPRRALAPWPPPPPPPAGPANGQRAHTPGPGPDAWRVWRFLGLPVERQCASAVRCSAGSARAHVCRLRVHQRIAAYFILSSPLLRLASHCLASLRRTLSCTATPKHHDHFAPRSLILDFAGESESRARHRQGPPLYGPPPCAQPGRARSRSPQARNTPSSQVDLISAVVPRRPRHG